MESSHTESSGWLDRPVSVVIPQIKIETLLIFLILTLAVLSRFIDLGERVMSHDEVNHVVPSFDLFQGKGYRHDPITHGPLQFHLIALSFFIMGDNDFSARVPAAFFSLAAVGMVIFGFRRYLGRTGALLGGVLFLISPFMLYYGRYTRNEGLIELLGVVMLYAVLRYLDRGDRNSLFLLTGSLVLHFTAKETAFIYAAQLLLFLAVLFLARISKNRWEDPGTRHRFLVMMLAAIVFLLAALGIAIWNEATLPAPTEIPALTEPANENASPLPVLTPLLTAELVAIILSLISAGLGAYHLIKGLGWKAIRSERAFDMLILVGTLVLPQLSAFPTKMAGWDPLDYSSTGISRTAIFVVLFLVLSILVGLWWNFRLWAINAILFYGVFIIFFTTFFTNGLGFFTGLVGSLGYWLSQQGVQRGSQPWYYFLLVQIPVYEFLAALGTALALYLGLRYHRFSTIPGISPASPQQEDQVTGSEDGEIVTHTVTGDDPTQGVRLPVLPLLLFWSFSSLVAYTVAGEKMPWLTVHIALPLLLTASWGFGYLIDSISWKELNNRRGYFAILILPVFIVSLASVFGSLLGQYPPFQGNTTQQIQTTSAFLFALIAFVGCLFGLRALLPGWKVRDVTQLIGLAFFAILAVLTARAAYRAAFINYDYATEYLVYAHAAPGPKQVQNEIEEISRRLTGGNDIQVAYDNDGLYPYWWYLRNFPNHRWYTDKPTRDLQDFPLIIAGDATMSKMEPIIKNDFVSFTYIRLWWPNQSYFNLTWERLANVIRDPRLRSALFSIWLNRDYSDYIQLSGDNSFTIENWQPSSKMRFYIRKDIAAQIWDYGVAPAPVDQSVQTDPYEGLILSLSPDIRLGMQGSGAGQLNAPRGLAVAPDGSIYVADSKNHRIQRFSPDGEVLNTWGSFADILTGTAPGGTFSEPWGVAVDQDGYVYAADTWNHRIQKFSATGEFVTMWGYFGQGEAPDAFWGPRDVKVDEQGRVYVTDTGNKRVVIFESDGRYINQFGSTGVQPGQYDEPVGISISQDGEIFIADTWNQRVQVVKPDPDRQFFLPESQWEVYGWFGQSLENKPYLTWTRMDHVFVTDPEGYRILEFDTDGKFIRGFSDWAGLQDISSLPAGIVEDGEGRIWISDAGSGTLLRFTLPPHSQ